MSAHKTKRSLFDQVMVPNYAPMHMIPIRGLGARVWDQNDAEYIDLGGGIAVNSLGHCHPELVAALNEQSQKLWHLSNVYTNEPALKLAQTLCDLTFADRVFFCNSGAEANEAALKLGRRWGWHQEGEAKHEIVSALGSFHGRTLFTVAVGGQAKYTDGFRPVPPGIHHVPFNDIEALKAAVNPNTCAVILEPIQGEGGIYPAHRAYLEAARQLCDQYNALLIIDEVQTGVGRSGALYAYEHYQVIPDVLTSAKSLGSGFPVAAMLASERASSVLTPGTHGTTYGGNPLACHVANTVLDIVQRSELRQNVVERHQQLVSGLEQINQNLNLFSEIRGMGLLIGAELNTQWHGRANELVALALDHGLMMLQAGPNVLRFAPALVITQYELAEGLNRLEITLQQWLSQSDVLV
jgi:acetylornithine/N-succinyldiaminopimelate aminotransferase